MMSSREVEEYLSYHHLPQLLESLLTGLLYHHPEDPVSFLQSCLITTRQLGGPEGITWDTFIHMERSQLSARPPKTTSITPILSLSSMKPETPPSLPSTTPSTISKTTPLASTTPPQPKLLKMASQIPPITPSVPPKTIHITPPIKPHIIPQMPPTSTVAPLTHSRPQIPSIKAKTSAELKVFRPAPLEPAVTPPPVRPKSEEQRGTKTFNTDASTPGPPPSPVRSQLSIDSDSDMTESSGLMQEVSILPTQRSRPLVIFIIGGPGSGKGSHAARLARSFSLRVISLDELLRRQLLNQASPSRKWSVISEMMGHGELGPQEDTISELRQQLIGQQEVRGFIVDGFPRDVHQALSFQEQIGSPDLVMLLLCSIETLHYRLQQRATQLGLLGDNSHALRRRLETFQRDIVSIRRYYRHLHLMTQVDADRDEEVVFNNLSTIIREKLLLNDSDLADFPGCSSVVSSINH